MYCVFSVSICVRLYVYIYIPICSLFCVWVAYLFPLSLSFTYSSRLHFFQLFLSICCCCCCCCFTLFLVHPFILLLLILLSLFLLLSLSHTQGDTHGNTQWWVTLHTLPWSSFRTLSTALILILHGVRSIAFSFSLFADNAYRHKEFQFHGWHGWCVCVCLCLFVVIWMFMAFACTFITTFLCVLMGWGVVWFKNQEMVLCGINSEWGRASFIDLTKAETLLGIMILVYSYKGCFF